jgi:hypothetical protein
MTSPSFSFHNGLGSASAWQFMARPSELSSRGGKRWTFANFGELKESAQMLCASAEKTAGVFWSKMKVSGA